MSIFPNWKTDRPYAIAVFLLAISAIIYLGVKTDNILRQSSQIDKPTPYEHTIIVDGEGTVTGKPDIATVSMGTESKGVDVATAQQSNTTVMSSITEQLKAMGISGDDIQTSSYNVYEDLQWDPEANTSISKGWIVSNYVTVKVRDTTKLPDVLNMAGKNGITNISGPTFTIDDTTNLKSEARIKAIAQAKTKAQEIANSLGMKLEAAVGYSEWAPSTDYPYLSGLGMGGSAESIKSSIETGTNEVTLDVSITYKLVD